MLTHLDGRLWRTLVALLARPGRLTVEYFLDHRERYLPPVRLYLVMSLVFFAFVNLGEHAAPRVARGAESASTSGAGCTQIAGADVAARWLRTICQRVAADNGASLLEAMRRNVPRMMFVFLPVLAGVLKLLYWRPRRLYVQHLVFFLHTHAAMFIAILGMLLVDRVARALPATAGPLGLAQFALSLYLPWYLYRAVRVTYGQGRMLSLAKLSVIALAYGICLALMLMLTAAVSLRAG